MRTPGSGENPTRDAPLPEANGVAETFDLPTSSMGGRGRGVTVERVAIAWECAGQPRRRAFDEITTIRMWADLHSGDGLFALCDITFADGDRLRLMMTDDDFDPRKGMKYREYREFVIRFFGRLDPAQQARIIFREGPSAATRMSWIVVSAGGLAAFLGIMVFGVLFGWYGQQDNSWLLFPLSLLFAVLMAALLVVSLKSGQKTFDPGAVPPQALPPVPDHAGRPGRGAG